MPVLGLNQILRIRIFETFVNRKVLILRIFSEKKDNSKKNSKKKTKNNNLCKYREHCEFRTLI